VPEGVSKEEWMAELDYWGYIPLTISTLSACSDLAASVKRGAERPIAVLKSLLDKSDAWENVRRDEDHRARISMSFNNGNRFKSHSDDDADPGVDMSTWIRNHAELLSDYICKKLGADEIKVKAFARMEKRSWWPSSDSGAGMELICYFKIDE
jgi:hypothetical protein